MTAYATVNDLHSDRRTDADRADVRAVQVAGWQECHHVVLATALGSAHGVHQVIDPANPGKAGVAISWRKDAAALIAKGLAVGHLAVEGMMGRFLAWAVLEIDDRLHLVISGHRPPLRLKHLWPTFDANVDSLIDRLRAQYAPDVVVVLLDANQAPPTPLITRTGLSWHGVGIDGALVAGAAVTNVRQLPLGDSDHRPVAMTVTPKEKPVASTAKTDALIAALRRRGVEVLTHAQWGSLQAALYRQRLTSHPHGLLPGQPVDTLWNHITVTSDDGPLIGDFKADMREVERIGVSRFGSGFSYNFGVDANADRPRLALGQFLEAKGTHTVNDKGTPGYSYNQNKVALAVAWVGMPGNKLNTHAVNAIVQLNAALIEVGAMTNHYDNVPHSLVAAKDCPTDELRNRLAEIKRRALLVVKPPAPAPVAPAANQADMLATHIYNARVEAQRLHELNPTETYYLDIHRQLRAPFDAAAAKSTKF